MPLHNYRLLTCHGMLQIIVTYHLFKTYLFTDHFLPNCSRLLVLYSTLYSSLAVLYLGHAKNSNVT